MTVEYDSRPRIEDVIAIQEKCFVKHFKDANIAVAELKNSIAVEIKSKEKHDKADALAKLEQQLVLREQQVTLKEAELAAKEMHLNTKEMQLKNFEQRLLEKEKLASATVPAMSTAHENATTNIITNVSAPPVVRRPLQFVNANANMNPGFKIYQDPVVAKQSSDAPPVSTSEEYHTADIVLADPSHGPAANTRRRSLTAGTMPSNNLNIGANASKDITDGVRRAKELLNVGPQKNLMVGNGKENALAAYPMPPPPPPIGATGISCNPSVAPVGLRKRSSIGGVDSPSKRVRIAPAPTYMANNVIMKPNMMMKPGAAAANNGPTFTYANQYRQPNSNMQAATALL